MKIVIGLVGVKTSGKSTASILLKKMIPEAKEVAIADKLKNVCSEVFKIERDHFDDQLKKEVPFKVPVVLNFEKIGKILELYNTPESHRNYDRYISVVNIALRSPREVAQIIGTEVLRTALGPDVHCSSVSIHEGVNIVTDVRFNNEFEFFKSVYGDSFIPLYINRESVEKLVTDSSHSSEKEVFLFKDKCIRIDNNNSLEALEQQLENISRRIHGEEIN